MWARIKRIFRSIFGAIIGASEDPKLILEQNVRDMRDKIPQMNTGIAKARAGIVRLEREATNYQEQVTKLTARIKACLMAKDEALAGQFATELKRVKEALVRNKQQTESAQAAYESLLKLKENYMREMKRKTDEAMTAIREAESAKWKNELAGVFESFEIADVDSTHSEMVDKLRSEADEAQGKLMMAQESVDMKSIEIEKKAQELEGQELLREFKAELGLDKEQEQKGEDEEEQQTIAIEPQGSKSD